MKYVRKRDGKLEPFNQERITNAIWKAARAVGGKDRKQAKFISDEVLAELRSRFGEDGCPTVEEIQDIVEKRVIEIVKSCKELYGKALGGKDTAVLSDRFSRIKRRYLTLKKIAAFYERWLKMEFSKSLMRAYHALRKVNSIIKKMKDKSNPSGPQAFLDNG